MRSTSSSITSPSVKKAAGLEAAAVSDRARAEKFSGMDGFVLRHVGENLLEGEQHARRRSGCAHLSVDAYGDLEALRVAEFVRRHYPRPKGVGAVEALALGWARRPRISTACRSRAEKSLKIV